MSEKGLQFIEFISSEKKILCEKIGCDPDILLLGRSNWLLLKETLRTLIASGKKVSGAEVKIIEGTQLIIVPEESYFGLTYKDPNKAVQI